MSSLNDYIVNLRISESPADADSREDARQRRVRINATRTYLVILLLVLMIFLVVSLISSEPKLVQLNFPNLEQFQTLPDDARCFCSEPSISYASFFSGQIRFHEICSSDFLSTQWIEVIFTSGDSSSRLPEHFRVFAASQFQSLASLFILSRSHINQALISFQQESLFSPDVLSSNLFGSRIYQSINQLISDALEEFRQHLQMVRQMIVGNQLVSGSESNFIASKTQTDDDRIRLDLLPMRFIDRNGRFCDCSVSSDCVEYGWSRQLGNSNWTKVLGLTIACLPIDAILQSTLECLYEQRCLNALITLFNIRQNFMAMPYPQLSRFPLNASVQSITDEMMVETWNFTISYSAYYERCAPKSCIYSTKGKNGVWAVLFKLIGILGGTTMILGIFMPLSIRGIEQSQVAPIPQETNETARQSHPTYQLLRMLREMNWFADPQSTDRHRRYQRYSTRLCIVLTIMSLVTIGVFTTRSEIVSVQTVLHPKKSEYQSLYEQHSQQLTCPCSSMSIPQSAFLFIQPSFHQLCSSELVSLPSIVNSNPSLPAWDFRRIAPAYFRLLQIFCQQSHTLVASSLSHFYDTKFINKLVVPRILLGAQADASFTAWRSSLTRQFAYQIELLSSMIGGNQLLSSLNFNYDARRTSADVHLQPSIFANCSCRLSSTCSRNVTIYSDDLASNDARELYQFANFFYGCFPTAGLLQSTLECFYDPFCLSEIEQHLSSSAGTSLNFTALDANLNNPHESVSSMLSRSLVDAWEMNISFDEYYAACAPQSCSFPYITRPSVFSVITIILGVFGGVTFVFEKLFLILLRFVEIFAWTRQNLRDAMRRWFTCADQERTIQQLHFIFVLVALSTLYLLNSLAPKLITVRVSYPSLQVYQSLFDRFPATLDCSCSQIAIKYSSFLQMETSVHQVCSSAFVTDAWIAAALNLNDSLDSAPEQFRLLNSLCFWSQQSLQDSFNQLYNADLISTTPMSMSLFSARMQAIIASIRSMASTSFLNLLFLFRQITGENQIMTALSTNWRLFSLEWNSTEPIVLTRALLYQSCSCAQSSSCVQASRRMYAGCYPLEALLQANLQCLYDQSCIDPSNTFPALNQFQPSRFSMANTVEEIIEQLMTDELISHISYQSYFAQCAPTVCSYSYSAQGDRLEALTILISLYGGLMVIGRWLAVILVRMGRCRTPPTASSLT